MCNETQLHALQNGFFGLKCSERQESAAAFRERLTLASLILQTPGADEIFLIRFKAGLSARLQDQAMLVTGDFDTVVSEVPRLSSARQTIFRERVREVQEPKADGYGSK